MLVCWSHPSQRCGIHLLFHRIYVLPILPCYHSLVITPHRRLAPSFLAWRSSVYRLPALGTSVFSLQHCTAALSAHNWMCNQAFTLVITFQRPVY